MGAWTVWSYFPFADINGDGFLRSGPGATRWPQTRDDTGEWDRRDFWAVDGGTTQFAQRLSISRFVIFIHYSFPPIAQKKKAEPQYSWVSTSPVARFRISPDLIYNDSPKMKLFSQITKKNQKIFRFKGTNGRVKVDRFLMFWHFFNRTAPQKTG